MSACTPSAPAIPVAEVITAAPPVDAVTVAAPDGTGSSAVQTSAALFEESPVVVLGAGDTMLTAASAAVSLGIPLLDAPTTATQREALETELDRLKTTTVLAIGVETGAEELATDRRVVLPVAGDAASVISALRLDSAPTPAMRDQTPVAAVAGLDPLGDTIIGERTREASSSAQAAPVPDVTPGRTLSATMALVPDDAADLAAAATARAAGADVVVLPEDGSDLFAAPDAVAALEASGSVSVLAIGAGLSADPALQWKVDVAASGGRLPNGGFHWFPDHTLVAMYGVPGSSSLGVLGEQDVAASVERAKGIAAPYDSLTDTTVVPTFEIIATVAAGDAGADGDYSNEVPAETIAPWVQAASGAGMQVILDLQPGRTDFLTQARRYEQLLLLPNVGLALDPEWRLAPDQVPLGQIGAVDAAEVNTVITWLADLTRDNALPQKPLVLHQFRTSMIGNRGALDTSRAEVALLIHADGQGGQPAKQATWNALHVDAPAGIAWGWKNFYDEDLPPLSPEQTMTQVLPAPSMISYQ